MSNTIPPITDPLGRHWEQPDPASFLIDDTHVIMNQKAFDVLKNYTGSQPTGTYVGKCWKMKNTGGWYLAWFGFDPEPGYCSNNYRKILICD